MSAYFLDSFYYVSNLSTISGMISLFDLATFTLSTVEGHKLYIFLEQRSKNHYDIGTFSSYSFLEYLYFFSI